MDCVRVFRNAAFKYACTYLGAKIDRQPPEGCGCVGGKEGKGLGKERVWEAHGREQWGGGGLWEGWGRESKEGKLG